jgi:hypothetical protein
MLIFSYTEQMEIIVSHPRGKIAGSAGICFINFIERHINVTVSGGYVTFIKGKRFFTSVTGKRN